MWILPFQWTCLASYLKVYVILALVLWLSIWNKSISWQLPPQHSWKRWKLTLWKKPSKSFVGNAFKLEYWRETSRCGFKHLHLTPLDSHMEDFALWTMTWLGKKFLTFTRFHMIKDTFTFGPITLKAPKNDMKFHLMVWYPSILKGGWDPVHLLHVRRCSRLKNIYSATFSFIPVLNTGGHKKLPWTPSPPGWVCVCVCTFSKEVKTCISSWWSFTWMYFISASSIGFYMVIRGQWIFSSVLDEQGVPGASLSLAPTKTLIVCLWYEERTLSSRTCNNNNMDMVNKLCLVGVLLGFLVPSCWFAITKEHLLSWPRHLMP